MNRPILIPILFALGTALFWGLYGPTIGNAHGKPPSEGGWSPFKPYVFIGIAYLVIAIIGGLIAMSMKGDSFSYRGEHFSPAKWGFLAGCLGAGGAICLTSAMMISKGNATLVMPIVFGGAISVTALVGAMRSHVSISPWVWMGIGLCIVGAVMIARNQPHHAPPKPATAVEPQATSSPDDVPVPSADASV